MDPKLEEGIRTGYATAGAGVPTKGEWRLARAAYVRNVIRALWEADKGFGLDPANSGSLAELVDMAEENLLRVTRLVGDAFATQPGTRPMSTPHPPSGGETT